MANFNNDAGWTFKMPVSSQPFFAGQTSSLSESLDPSSVSRKSGSSDPFFYEIGDDNFQTGVPEEEALFTAIEELNSFASQWQARGIDVTKPVWSNPDSLRANAEFNRMYSRAKQLANQVRVGHEAEKAYQEQRLKDGIVGPAYSNDGRATQYQDLSQLQNLGFMENIAKDFNKNSGLVSTVGARDEINSKGAELEAFLTSLESQYGPEGRAYIQAIRERIQPAVYDSTKDLDRAEDVRQFDRKEERVRDEFAKSLDIKKKNLGLAWSKLNFEKKTAKQKSDSANWFVKKAVGLLEGYNWDQNGVAYKDGEEIDVAEELGLNGTPYKDGVIESLQNAGDGKHFIVNGVDKVDITELAYGITEDMKFANSVDAQLSERYPQYTNDAGEFSTSDLPSPEDAMGLFDSIEDDDSKPKKNRKWWNPSTW